MSFWLPSVTDKNAENATRLDCLRDGGEATSFFVAVVPHDERQLHFLVLLYHRMIAFTNCIVCARMQCDHVIHKFVLHTYNVGFLIPSCKYQQLRTKIAQQWVSTNCFFGISIVICFVATFEFANHMMSYG